MKEDGQIQTIRECDCGRRTKEAVECLFCQRERMRNAAPEMLAALRYGLAVGQIVGESKVVAQRAIALATGPNSN